MTTNTTKEKIEAIDFSSSYQALHIALDYVNETRPDFENNGPQKWVGDLIILLESTIKTLHDLEIKHIDELVDRKDEETGEVHQVLVRMQDENGFDKALKQYTSAQEQFNTYFDQHVQMIKEGKA